MSSPTNLEQITFINWLSNSLQVVLWIQTVTPQLHL